MMVLSQQQQHLYHCQQILLSTAVEMKLLQIHLTWAFTMVADDIEWSTANLALLPHLAALMEEITPC